VVPTPEAIRDQVARIVASSGFVSAGRLAPFLGFVVDRMLAGEPIKESLVGVAVFGRPADYDPRLDPIVRVEARRLRLRLAEYYAGPGAQDPVLVDLPKGGYLPVFAYREDTVALGTEGLLPVPLTTGRRRRWWWPVLALAILALVVGGGLLLSHHPEAPQTSVAVLPFVNLSDDARDQYFSEGLTEEIIDRLARIRGLRVVARSSSFQWKGSAQDLREVGRKLSATAVVEGSVRRAGNTLRVTAQLVNVADGFQLWSQSYERKTSDVFAIQDEVARAVANALRVELRVGLEPRPEPPTGSLNAHNLYLKGRYHLNHDAMAGLELAADSFERATLADPQYATAHAALAGTYAVLAYYRLRPASEAWSRAKAEADRALAIDPGMAEAHAVRGVATALDEWRWQEAEPFFRRALQLDPDSSDVHVFYIWGLLLPRGRLAEASAHADRAIALDPGSSLAHQIRSFVLLVQHRLDEAIPSYQRSAELSPSNGDIQWDLGMALAYGGQREAAMRQFRLGGNIHSGGGWEPGVAELALLGEPQEARAVIARWPGFHQQRPLYIAYAYGLLGDAGDAAQWLARAYQEHDPQVIWAKVDPRLDKVRQDPRIQAVIRKIGL
jgi:TolB-like protein/Flp pilus assembly protein TadD